MTRGKGGNIRAQDLPYGELYKHAETQLVPTLQRPYTWGKDQVKKLFDDIAENEAGYYIGSIVVILAKGSSSREEIVDGQQRLTTLSLLLIAIKRRLDEAAAEGAVADEDPADLLIKYLAKNERRVRLAFTNPNSDAVYLQLLDNTGLPDPADLTEVQKTFIDNFNYIQTLVDEHLSATGNTLKKILEKIKQLQLILISCEDSSAAYALFESINATGIDLASTDLIKNGIFRRLANNSKKLSEAERKWQNIEDIFNEDSSFLKTFIRHEWISRGTYTSHGKIFEKFEKAYPLKKPDAISGYLDTLESSAKIYDALRKARTDVLYGNKGGQARFNIREVKEALEFLSFLGVDQVYSVLLYSFNNDEKSFRKMLIRLVSFQFLFKYLPGSPSTVERKFAEYCVSHEKDVLLKELTELCQNKKEEFVKKFLEKIKYKDGMSGDVQYVLERLAEVRDKVGQFKKPTIEHIIPKNFSARPKQLEKLSSADYRSLVNRLGNLTVVEKDDNGSILGDKPFSKKEPYFNDSPRKSHKDIVTYSQDFKNSPEYAIDLRGKELAGEIYDTFIKSLNSGSL